MATNELNTRIILKNDDTAAWENNAPTLKRGEVGIVFDRPTSQSGTQTTMLVGNGNTNLDLYAKASDVYSWAKASSKPNYTANEISGLDTSISTAITNNNNEAPTYVDLSSYCTNNYVINSGNENAYLWEKNGWVTIVGNRRVPSGDNSWASGTWYSIIELPAKYKPLKVIEFSVGSKTKIDNLGIAGRIETDGVVKLRQAGGGQNFLSAFCVTYPI